MDIFVHLLSMSPLWFPLQARWSWSSLSIRTWAPSWQPRTPLCGWDWGLARGQRSGVGAWWSTPMSSLLLCTEAPTECTSPSRSYSLWGTCRSVWKFYFEINTENEQLPNEAVHNLVTECCEKTLMCLDVCPDSWTTTLAPTALSGTHQGCLVVAGGPHRAAACYTLTTHTLPVPATTCPAMLSSWRTSNQL